MNRDGDELAALEWDDGEEPTAPEPDGWRRRATPLVVLAVIGLLFVVATVAGGGDDPSAEDARSSAATSTTTSTSTTARASAASDEAEPLTTTTLPFASEPTGGRRLLFLDGSRLVVADLDASTITTRNLPSSGNVRRFGTATQSIVVTGDDVFVSDGNEALRLSTALRPEEEPRHVGLSLLTFRSARQGRVWLTQQRDDGFVITEVDGSGRVTTPARVLPADTVPVATAGSSGVVLTRAGEVLVWNPADGVVRWTSPPGVALLGVAGSSVVWQRYCDGPICSFHVTDVATGADRTYPLPGQLWEPFPRPSFSAHPNSHTVAASITPNEVGAPTQVLFLDVRRGSQVSIPVANLGLPVWSPGGDWLFLFGGSDGPERLHVSAAVNVGRIEDGRFRDVTLRVPREAIGTAVAVL